MAELLSDLSAYLRLAASKPFVWGECDCCLFLGDWVDLKLGTGFAAAFRGRYGSLASALKVMESEGGLLAILERGAALSGVARTEWPVAGDAGLVMTPLGETAAIRTAIGWACKSPSGLIVESFPSLACWSL